MKNAGARWSAKNNMRCWGSVMLLCLLLGPLHLSAQEIQIPADTSHIEEQAFAQCLAASCVIVPEGVVSIGKEAFRGCTGLKEITLPASLEAIGEDILTDCSESLWVHCIPGSSALQWARAQSLDYDANTQYRALIIGQSYAGTSYVLYGPANDARSLRFCLAEMQKTSWTVTQKTNLTASGILSAIESAFSQATENDVSLFYYSGHGAQNGALFGGDLTQLSPDSLRLALDAVPGRKIVIVDACYSGQLIDESTVMSLTADDAPDFNSSFLSAFTTRSRGALNADGYFVISSAGPRELAAEGTVESDGSSKIMGFFTYGLCKGLGWDGVTSRSGPSLADQNADEAISMKEAAVYASAQARLMNSNQTAQYWPADTAWFAPFRP